MYFPSTPLVPLLFPSSDWERHGGMCGEEESRGNWLRLTHVHLEGWQLNWDVSVCMCDFFGPIDGMNLKLLMQWAHATRLILIYFSFDKIFSKSRKIKNMIYLIWFARCRHVNWYNMMDCQNNFVHIILTLRILAIPFSYLRRGRMKRRNWLTRVCLGGWPLNYRSYLSPVVIYNVYVSLALWKVSIW